MSLLITPIVSEKAYAQANSLNTYVFKVPLSTNKIEVKKAVEQLYEVNVVDVNVVVSKGKLKKSYTKKGKTIKGTRSDFKKAYVTLKEGQSIAVFANQEEEETK